jgi:hypothetical protein
LPEGATSPMPFCPHPKMQPHRPGPAATPKGNCASLRPSTPPRRVVPMTPASSTRKWFPLTAADVSENPSPSPLSTLPKECFRRPGGPASQPPEGNLSAGPQQRYRRIRIAVGPSEEEPAFRPNSASICRIAGTDVSNSKLLKVPILRGYAETHRTSKANPGGPAATTEAALARRFPSTTRTALSSTEVEFRSGPAC